MEQKTLFILIVGVGALLCVDGVFGKPSSSRRSEEPAENGESPTALSVGSSVENSKIADILFGSGPHNVTSSESSVSSAIVPRRKLKKHRNKHKRPGHNHHKRKSHSHRPRNKKHRIHKTRPTLEQPLSAEATKSAATAPEILTLTTPSNATAQLPIPIDIPTTELSSKRKAKRHHHLHHNPHKRFHNRRRRLRAHKQISHSEEKKV